MRHENQLTGPVANRPEFLFNLRHVLMREWLVCVERVHALRVMRIRSRFRARTRRTRLRVYHNPACNEIVSHQRRQTEQSRCCETTGIANQLRTLYCFAICLSQTVDKVSLQLDYRRFAATVLLKLDFVAQAEVSRKIYHPD